MSRILFDIADAVLALTRCRLGTKAKTIKRSPTVAAPLSAGARARVLRRLQENTEHFLDFDVFENRERAGL